MKFLLLFLISIKVLVAGNYSLRLSSSVATDYDFGQIVTAKIGKFQKDSTVYAVDAGYLLPQISNSLPFDIYIKSGLSYFEQPPSEAAIYEVTLYVKAYYNFDFFHNRVRFGFGEGGSYTSAILAVERADAQAYNDNNSHYLNYLDVSLDDDLGRLSGLESLKEMYVGLLLKHRSGIFGLVNNVRHGGSNHVGFYIEKNF